MVHISVSSEKKSWRLKSIHEQSIRTKNLSAILLNRTSNFNSCRNVLQVGWIISAYNYDRISLDSFFLRFPRQIHQIRRVSGERSNDPPVPPTIEFVPFRFVCRRSRSPRYFIWRHFARRGILKNSRHSTERAQEHARFSDRMPSSFLPLLRKMKSRKAPKGIEKVVDDVIVIVIVQKDIGKAFLVAFLIDKKSQTFRVASHV